MTTSKKGATKKGAKKQVSEKDRIRESSKKDDGARAPVDSQMPHVAENLAGSDAARELQNPHLPAPQGIAAPAEDADDGSIKSRSLRRGSVVYLPNETTPITLEEDVKIKYDGMASDKRFAGMLSQDRSYDNFSRNIPQLKGTWNPLNGRLMEDDEEGVDMGVIPKADEVGKDLGPVVVKDEEGVDKGKPKAVKAAKPMARGNRLARLAKARAIPFGGRVKAKAAGTMKAVETAMKAAPTIAPKAKKKG